MPREKARIAPERKPLALRRRAPVDRATCALGASLAIVLHSGAARAEAPAHAISPEAATVLAVRSGSASTGYPVEDRVRGGFRLGFQWGMTPAFTVGLAYERVGGGRERVRFDDGYASDTRRTLDAILASVRVFPVVTPSARAFVELGVGFSRESVEQTGVRTLPTMPYRCAATSSGSLALGPAVGGEIGVAGPVALVARAYATFHRLGDDTLSDDSAAPCAAGAGTMLITGASLGLAYRFDLGHLRPAPGLTLILDTR